MEVFLIVIGFITIINTITVLLKTGLYFLDWGVKERIMKVTTKLGDVRYQVESYFVFPFFTLDRGELHTELHDAKWDMQAKNSKRISKREVVE